MSSIETNEYAWQTEPLAADLVRHQLELFLQALPKARRLADRMRRETGTRLSDWIDHFGLQDNAELVANLERAGFSATALPSATIWRHPGALFPSFRLSDAGCDSMAIKVESVANFLLAHSIPTEIVGQPLARLRMARIADARTREMWVIERHGCSDFQPSDQHAIDPAAVLQVAEDFLLRRRRFDEPAAGFDYARKLIAGAKALIGVDYACDLFFSAERRYWESRNRAARVQLQRQNRLGLGWANHDHHTYRSSRRYFAQLIQVLEDLGFTCRERFYGGADAGWGAQVLEQSATGIVIFADVDLTPEEVTGDFAHAGLEPKAELGTVGLWCQLHGEAFFQAGMHHLECQFDFDAARDQLAREGISTMAPFTDFDHLKQAFTDGERWPVDSDRIDQALSAGWITPEQASTFLSDGSIGSHLEILQRDLGYKGFNQTGISEIIRQTDPRHGAGVL